MGITSWPKLQFKIDAALSAGVDKLITFEFSHFMSPHSIWPSARHLFDRYRGRYCRKAPANQGDQTLAR